jgi:hypothetical protein
MLAICDSFSGPEHKTCLMNLCDLQQEESSFVLIFSTKSHPIEGFYAFGQMEVSACLAD